MKISYGITVCKELTEIQRLVSFLLENKRLEDDIVITYDSKNGSKDSVPLVLTFNLLFNSSVKY